LSALANSATLDPVASSRGDGEQAANPTASATHGAMFSLDIGSPVFLQVYGAKKLGASLACALNKVLQTSKSG
jgi:hypothetical protein